MVEPVQYTDFYKPYKYGEILKERLFVAKKVHGVIELKLYKVE